MGFAIDKAYINEDNETINIVVNKVGDTVLATKANLTRSYNSTCKFYNFKVCFKESYNNSTSAPIYIQK